MPQALFVVGLGGGQPVVRMENRFCRSGGDIHFVMPNSGYEQGGIILLTIFDAVRIWVKGKFTAKTEYLPSRRVGEHGRDHHQMLR